MKKLIIISTYANQECKVKTLEECIDSLLCLNYDIMVVSHYPIPENIQKKVNWVFYDKRNIILPPEYSTYNWFYNNKFDCNISQRSHNLTILINLSNGINIGKSLGYDFFYYLESDNIFNESDANKFEDLRVIMSSNDKKMILFNLIWNEPSGYSEAFETLIFGGMIDYFQKIFQIPTTIEEYSDLVSRTGKQAKNLTLELILFLVTIEHKEDFLIIKKSTTDFFNKSTINKYNISSRFEIVSNNLNEDLFLFLFNAQASKITCKINSRVKELHSNCWYYEPFTRDVALEVYNNLDELTDLRDFNFSEYTKEVASQIGSIKFK